MAQQVLQEIRRRLDGLRARPPSRNAAAGLYCSGKVVVRDALTQDCGPIFRLTTFQSLSFEGINLRQISLFAFHQVVGKVLESFRATAEARQGFRSGFD